MANPYDGLTPEQMPQAFTGADAQLFVQSYASSVVKGGAQTLQNYVDTHQPSWGVIVNPFPDINVLVWYDASNNLHVIEQIPSVVATQIALPAYHTADESFLYNLSQQAAALAGSTFDWSKYALVGAVVVLLIVYSPQIKSVFK